VMVIGADEDIWPTRNRAQFFPVHSGRGRRNLDTRHGARRCTVSERVYVAGV
jgi:hypothetical protein